MVTDTLVAITLLRNNFISGSQLGVKRAALQTSASRAKPTWSCTRATRRAICRPERLQHGCACAFTGDSTFEMEFPYCDMQAEALVLGQSSLPRRNLRHRRA